MNFKHFFAKYFLFFEKNTQFFFNFIFKGGSQKKKIQDGHPESEKMAPDQQNDIKSDKNLSNKI